MSEFKEIKTQEEFDTAIKERLARENKKYEGFVSPDKLAELKADYEKEISKKYDFLVLNENLKYVDYQPGGMSNSMLKQYYNRSLIHI